jgi:hypothetical protein
MVPNPVLDVRSPQRLLWSEVHGRIAVAGRDREQVRQPGDGLTEIIGPLRQYRLNFGQALLLRILTSEAGCALKLSSARMQGAVLMVGRAEIPHSGMWGAAHQTVFWRKRPNTCIFRECLHYGRAAAGRLTGANVVGL